MKLTLEVYSTSAGDTGGAPSFGVRLRDRRALEAGALYDPLDVNFLVDGEFIPAPETVAVSIYRPSEDGEGALVATTAGSAFAQVPGHSMMHRGVLATATSGFDSWYEEKTRCPDGDRTYPVPVFSILEVKWSCGHADYVARAGAVPAVLTPIGVRAVKGLDGADGEDGKAPEVDVAELGGGSYRMTVTFPDGTVKTVNWRDGRDGDGTDFPAPVSPADATRDDQYAGALAVQGLLDSLRKDLSGVKGRLDVIDSLAGLETLEGIQNGLAAKVDKRAGYDLVSTGYIRVLGDFIDTFGGFGGIAGLDKITFNELGTDLADRIKALEAAVDSLPSSGGDGTLNAGYVEFLDKIVASGDDPAQRILGAVGLVLAESNDAGTGVWKAVNANAKGLAELEAKVGSGGPPSIPAELEAMIRNSVQKDALGRGFSSNDFTQDYIDRINNSVQKEAGKGLSTVDFTMERAEKLDALYNSSSTLNPPVKPDENAREGQPADAKDTYEALKDLSFNTASDSYGSDWAGRITAVRPAAIAQLYDVGLESFDLEWLDPDTSSGAGWYLTRVTFTLAFKNSHPDDYIYSDGTYTYEGLTFVSGDRNATLFPNIRFDVLVPRVDGTGSTKIDVYLESSRELYLYKGDPYVTKTYVDDRVAKASGGTDDYDDLNNKPSINGRELSGDMTAADLGLSTVEGAADDMGGPGVAAHAVTAQHAGHADVSSTARSAETATRAYRASALEKADGTVVEADAVLGQSSLKRDKTDNIAAKDEAMFSEWTFTCESPTDDAAVIAFVENATRLQFYDGKTTVHWGSPEYVGWDCEFDPAFSQPSGYIYGESLSRSPGAGDPHVESLSWIGLIADDGDSTKDTRITATRTKTIATKEGEPYVTPTGVEALVAKNAGTTDAADLAFYYPDGDVTSVEQITTDGIEYAVGDDGGAYVVRGDNLSGHVVLPWKVTINGNEYKVTAIGESAFDSEYRENNSFTSFTAPITVKSIGDSAFGYCSSLTSISLPSATSIGGYEFHGCKSLTAVSLPSATSIGEETFASFTSLTSVSLPSVTNLGASAFAGCESLTSVSLPSATYIGDMAFNYCTSLTSVSLPSATYIGDSAFRACDSLTSVSLPSAISVGGSAFRACASLTSVSLPSATGIGDYAFTECASLTSVSLPSVASIGNYAFTECASLMSVSLPSATSIGDSAFDMCGSLTSVSLPSATYIGGGAFYGCSSLDTVDFGSSPKSSVPSLSPGSGPAFEEVPISCKFIIPLGMYDEWITASGWSDLYADGYKFEGYASVSQVDATAVKLHAITPEVVDSKVTLKPVDGKANWVDGEVITQIFKERSFDFTWRYAWGYESGDLDDWFEVTTNDITLNPSTATITGYGSDEDDRLECIYLTLKQPIELNEVHGPEWMTPSQLDNFRIGTIPAGTEVIVSPEFYDATPEEESGPYETQTFYPELISGSLKGFDIYDKPNKVIDVDGGRYVLSYCDSVGSDATHTGESSVARAVHVSIPASTGSSRRASLTLTTNAEAELDVTWNGADEIIEAFPGASKLVPGTVVWNVKEVAPGEMLVNRTPGATGGAVTITGDNGTVYTLGVDSEGTLEVRA